jgi:hypothetical protein
MRQNRGSGQAILKSCLELYAGENVSWVEKDGEKSDRQETYE